MRTLDATGKTIDEAIFNGLHELDLSIDEVEIDILQHETKGVLGIGAKCAIVRLIEREPEQIVIPEYLTDAERTRSGERSGPRRDDRGPRPPRRDDRGPRPQSQDRQPRPEGGRPPQQRQEGDRPRQPRPEGARPPREGGPDRSRRDGRREDYPATPPRPQVDYSLEAAEGNAAADFLAGLLSHMGIEAKVLANVSEEGIRLRIDSASMGILIGHRGETLDAIQYLCSLHVNRTRKETGYTRVTIDTEGYRDKREETLTRLARKVASQVRSTGRPRTLEPMNPYERRVLHATLQSNPYVTTYSEGEEPNRRVVVAPRGREEKAAQAKE